MVALILLASACAAEFDLGDPSCDEGQCDESSRRRNIAIGIRDSAAGVGMNNAVLLAGIAEVETTLVHCWRDAPWACKGPASSSCGGGPVIAGSGDGACIKKRGGLGLFQLDAGTHTQTLAHYGREVLTIEGNTSEVVPFLVQRAIESVSGVNTEAQAISWMNSIRPVDGDPKFEAWLRFISWRFNGCQGCTSQANKYRRGTHKVQNEMGAAFWAATENAGSDSFIGTDCGADETVCDFSSASEDAICVDWADDASSGPHGFCSIHCESSCPDRFGFASTFCADLAGEPGVCAATPGPENGFCADIEGSTAQVVPQFVGTSGTEPTWKGVCAPPGNVKTCEASDGRKGECIDTSTMQCGGTMKSGLCPGASSIRCCL